MEYVIIKETLRGRCIMRIAIIDDIKEDRKYIHSLVDKYSQQNHLNNEVYEFAAGEEFLSLFKKGKYDLILSDIYMDNMSGIDMARNIRLTDEDCFIVFLTGSNSFAQESYELNTFSYIVKPVAEEKFFNMLIRIESKLKQNNNALHVTAKGGGSIKLCIPFNKIMYIDIVKRTVCIHMKDNIVEVLETFSQCSNQLLSNDSFCNCCKGVIVNFKYVRKVFNTDFLMANNDLVPIKKRYNQDIKSAYMSYKLKNIIEG